VKSCMVLVITCCDKVTDGVGESLAVFRREPGGSISGGEWQVEAMLSSVRRRHGVTRLAWTGAARMMEKKLSTIEASWGRGLPERCGSLSAPDIRPGHECALEGSPVVCTKCREAGRRETRSRLDALA